MVTSEGYQFYIVGGGWGKTKEVTIRLDVLKDSNGLQVTPRDAGGYDTTSPTASCSAAKTTEVIAKDFNRRVIQKTETRELAQKMLNHMAQLKEERAALRGHVAELEKLGYRFGQFASTETYCTEGYNTLVKPTHVKVYSSGKVIFEGSCNVADMSKIMVVFK